MQGSIELNGGQLIGAVVVHGATFLWFAMGVLRRIDRKLMAVFSRLGRIEQKLGIEATRAELAAEGGGE